jgi:nicotinamidase-related amidase
MRDVLLVVDILDDFGHDDGDALLASLRERARYVEATLTAARRAGVPLVYANDHHGVWDGDRRRLVAMALDGPGGALIEPLAPDADDRFVVKPRYSAFDHTPLELILRELGIDRILLAGAATEGCVVQTAIDGRELGFKITVLADACASPDERLEHLALTYLEEVVGAEIERVT